MYMQVQVYVLYDTCTKHVRNMYDTCMMLFIGHYTSAEGQTTCIWLKTGMLRCILGDDGGDGGGDGIVGVMVMGGTALYC